MPPALFALGIFDDGSHVYAQVGMECDSPISWDDRKILLTLNFSVH
jgi:hypothetical protein